MLFQIDADFRTGRPDCHQYKIPTVRQAESGCVTVHRVQRRLTMGTIDECQCCGIATNVAAQQRA